jgi:hypothetical protein
MFLQIQKYYRSALVFVFTFLFIIAFQAYQQKFYIERFQLAQGVEVLDLLSRQFYRWMIWFFIGLPLIFLVKKDKGKSMTFWLFTKHFLYICGLVLLNILVISLIQASEASSFTLQEFFQEYCLFFLFQKAPMYTIGYIAFTVILFFQFQHENLQITVQELIQTKDEDQRVHKTLKDDSRDDGKVLSIKIGNKLKIISIAEILWIEADDYCVIVHSKNQPSYTMRSSLKALENQLPNHFMRVHRKGLVNMRMVKEYRNANESILILNDASEVPVSKVNSKAVKVYLQQKS